MSTAAESSERTPDPPASQAVPWPRMAVALLSLVGILISGYLSLYHLGLIGRLYCGVSGACETVQSSKYSLLFGIPVAYIGLGGYVVILALALAGLQPARAGDRRISLALAALSVVAVCFTVYLSLLEQFVIHAWCRWCIGSAVVIVLILVFALIDLGAGRGGSAVLPGER